MSKTSTATSSISSTSLLTIVFIVLKLCKVIDWSWWWVTAPTWIPIAFAIVVFLVIAVVRSYHKVVNDAIAKGDKPEIYGTEPIKKSKFMQKLGIK